MSSSLETLVPKPIKRALKEPYVGVRARARMWALRRDLHRRYGPELVEAVHPDDEMFAFMVRDWKWRYHVERMEGPADALHTYLVSGDVMMRDLGTALAAEGRSFGSVPSFLEFASGYGRFTRFLVTKVPPTRVTVSDISHDAVDFARATFGVDGFYSEIQPTDLHHDGSYDVVFVASLFSHLNHDVWVPWLRRLYDMVAPGGLLVFSTHGSFARDVIFARWTDRFVEVEDGFSFILTNETDGRLPESYYGNTFVTEAWVTRQIDAHGTGTVRRMYPTMLWGSQDLYVVARED